jgi:hypothetical protein
MNSQEFRGTSARGNFQEALEQAVDRSDAVTATVADGLVRWTLREISGEKGGFAGINQLTVVIEAQLAR